MGKDKFKSKGTLTREELAAYLESVVTGLRQGSIILDNEDRPLILRPSDSIGAEVEIKQKGDKEKIELKFAWAPNRMQPIMTAGESPDVFLPSSEPGGAGAKKK